MLVQGQAHAEPQVCCWAGEAAKRSGKPGREYPILTDTGFLKTSPFIGF